MLKSIIIDIGPVYAVYDECFPIQLDPEMRDSVVAQVVSSHFVPKEKWATHMTADTMIQYLREMHNVQYEQASSAWRKMDDELLSLLVCVEPKIMGNEHVPVSFKMANQRTLILTFDIS